MWYLLPTVFILMLTVVVPVVADPPRLILLDAERLATAKRRLASGDTALAPAWDRLKADADAALGEGPFSVMNKPKPTPSGDMHDYISFGPYWWPDPDKPDGLPYICRDGVINPDARGPNTDSSQLAAMIRAVNRVSLAYYFSGNEKYASHAARLLKVWFLDEATRMNPHLRYGQSIPGVTEGWGIGIIETAGLRLIVDDVGLLKGSPSWTSDDQQGLVAWMGDYLTWLQTSQHGRDEDRQGNNHGTYYDLQVVALSLFVDRPEIARRVLAAVGERRIATQVTPDGRQRRELLRNRSLGYSVMNLEGLFALAAMGRHVDVNLWAFRAADVGTLQQALDFLVPYADPNVAWPHEQIVPFDRTELLPLLRQGMIVFGEHHYRSAIERMPATDAAASRAQLLWPH